MYIRWNVEHRSFGILLCVCFFFCFSPLCLQFFFFCFLSFWFRFQCSSLNAFRCSVTTLGAAATHVHLHTHTHMILYSTMLLRFGLSLRIKWYHYWGGCGFSVSILNRDLLNVPVFILACMHISRYFSVAHLWEWAVRERESKSFSTEKQSELWRERKREIWECRGIFANGFNELHNICMNISDWIWSWVLAWAYINGMCFVVIAMGCNDGHCVLGIVLPASHHVTLSGSTIELTSVSDWSSK